jgi:hypothetical protein
MNNNFMDEIKKGILESIKVKQKILENPKLLYTISQVAQEIINAQE